MRYLLRTLVVLLPALLLAPDAIAQKGGKAGGDPAPAAAAPQQCPDNMGAYAGSAEVLDCLCPADAQAGTVWGSDRYTADSRVCTAARHAGMVGRQGGPVRLRMGPAAPRFAGSSRNGVTTQNYGPYDATFSFEGERVAGAALPPSGPQQCPTNMDAYAGTDETLTCACPAGAARGAVWGSGPYTADSNVCTAARHAGAVGPRGGAVTIRLLPGAQRYPGSTRNGVTTQNYGPYDTSYAFDNAQVAAAPPPVAVPSTPVAPAAPQQCPTNMDAYADSDEVLSCVCPEGFSRGAVWGSGPYTADSNVCTAAIHAGAMPVRGGSVTMRMLPGAARYPGSTARGIATQNYGPYRASYQFEGVQASGPQQCPTNMSAYAGTDETLSCACPEGASRGAIWGTGTYTADSNVCTAAIHAGATPARGGSVTIRMMPGAARYPGTSARGVQSQNFGSYQASFQFEGVQASGPQQCPTNMSAYAGSDETLTCACPEGASRGAVWGSDAYTADSNLCTAALHAGAISRRGGEVSLRMLPGLPRYPGTSRNGITTQNFGPYQASYRFMNVSAGPQLCPDSMSAYAGSDETVQCVCTGEAVMRSAAVWGSDLYTADSGTCRAARHAGMVPLTGGNVTVRMLPGAPRYPGSARNGVTTQNYGEYAASFRFEGAQNLAAAAPVQAPVAESLRRTGKVSLYITFRTNSADLDISAATVLGQVRDALLADPALRLRLVGHTDNQGGPQINVPLSQRRAQSVRNWLLQNGVEASRLTAEGRGQNEPIADNGTEAGRSVNRRVEAARVD